MQFVVPQFIDIEPKIIGPIGPRQLIILIVAGGLIFLCWNLVSNLIVFILIALVVAGLGVVFAFVKVNGRPFHYFILSLIQTYTLPQIRVWEKEITPTKVEEEKKIKKETPVAPPKELLRSRKLSELALIVDTGGAYSPDEEEGEGENFDF